MSFKCQRQRRGHSIFTQLKGPHAWISIMSNICWHYKSRISIKWIIGHVLYMFKWQRLINVYTPPSSGKLHMGAQYCTYTVSTISDWLTISDMTLQCMWLTSKLEFNLWTCSNVLSRESPNSGYSVRKNDSNPYFITLCDKMKHIIAHSWNIIQSDGCYMKWSGVIGS